MKLCILTLRLFQIKKGCCITIQNSTTHILGKDRRNILYNLDLKPVFGGIVTERTLTYKKCEKVMEGNEKFMLLEPTILNDIIILSVINISKFTFPSHLQVFCI